jgi:folate-binding protein YgfZ
MQLKENFNKAEYTAAIDAVGAVDLSAWAKIIFTGADRVDFLQGLLTQDVLKIAPGLGAHTCLLTPKGKLLGDFALYNRGADFFAFAAPQAGPSIVGTLKKYAPLSDTAIADASNDFAAFYLTGAQASALLERLFGAGAGGADKQWASYTIKDTAFEIFQNPIFNAQGALIVVPRAKRDFLRYTLEIQGQSLGFSWIGADTFNVLRLESGAPIWGVDVTEENYPLEVGFLNAVSFDKGCYLGQETTNRIKTQARLPRQWTALKIDGGAQRGNPVADGAGAEKGFLTSVVFSPKINGTLAGAFLAADLITPPAELSVKTEKGPFPARAIDWPGLSHSN